VVENGTADPVVVRRTETVPPRRQARVPVGEELVDVDGGHERPVPGEHRVPRRSGVGLCGGDLDVALGEVAAEGLRDVGVGVEHGQGRLASLHAGDDLDERHSRVEPTTPGV